MTKRQNLKGMEMKAKKLLSTAVLAMALSGCVIHVNGQSADIELTKTLTIQAADLTKMDIDAGAGSLEVIGVNDATEIVVEAKILTTNDKNFLLTLDSNGNTAELVAEHNTNHSGYWNGNSPRIDLVVKVPSSLMLDVEDGSGNLVIRDMQNNLVVDDGSGAISISDIKGNVELDDGSGSAVISGINGNVAVTDGSGELTVANVTGDLSIDDGSGDIDVLNVTGSVLIDDGSGDIDVNTAGGLRIVDSGSGGLDIANVNGDVEIDD